MTEYDYDIVVVGGGPAGASAAKAAVDGGLKTLLVERQKMPRHKPCSGMVLPLANELIESHFGPIPPEALAQPSNGKGCLVHLSNGSVLELTAPNISVWRNKLDHWMCNQSGAEVRDATRLVDFAEWKDRVDVVCDGPEGELRFSCCVMVAADGGYSPVVRKLDPNYATDIPRNTYVQQDYHLATADLDPRYYHLFMTQGMGLMPTLYFKDELVVTDTIVQGTKVNPLREKYAKWLTRNYGFKSSETVRSLGCRALPAGIVNTFCLGTGRVLVAGEAAGFLNMAFEGISSAVATGNLAGRAAVTAEGLPPGPLYRRSARPEMDRTVLEWYPPALLTGRSVPWLMSSLMAAPLSVKMRLGLDGLSWVTQFGMKPHHMLQLTARKYINRGFDFHA